MSYVDEVIAIVEAKNPDQPEFLQAVKEVLESLRPIVDANEEKYRYESLLERLVEPDRIVMFRVPWACVSAITSTWASSNSWASSRSSRTP